MVQKILAAVVRLWAQVSEPGTQAFVLRVQIDMVVDAGRVRVPRLEEFTRLFCVSHCNNFGSVPIEAMRIAHTIINITPPDGSETTFNSECSNGGARSILLARCITLLARLPIAMFFVVCFILSLGFFFMAFSMATQELNENSDTEGILHIFDWGLLAFAIGAILLVICVIIQCILKCVIISSLPRATVKKQKQKKKKKKNKKRKKRKKKKKKKKGKKKKKKRKRK
ncbi:unnamed protein product [Schistocephalus solidus]|uniref:Uncharacterized protein n=1 Tax=Schistocephalus solidus TaxID=70667 RepID=A0A183SR51_SCHSO|nr:unnamed protein product [Schistocephalus solidus]